MAVKASSEIRGNMFKVEVSANRTKMTLRGALVVGSNYFR